MDPFMEGGPDVSTSFTLPSVNSFVNSPSTTPSLSRMDQTDEQQKSHAREQSLGDLAGGGRLLGALGSLQLHANSDSGHSLRCWATWPEPNEATWNTWCRCDPNQLPTKKRETRTWKLIPAGHEATYQQ